MDKHEADSSILERLKAGDMTACEDCVALHSDGLYRLSLRLLRDENEAEDIVQETYLNAFKAIDSFDGRSSLGTWLFRIAYNNAMMRLRKKHPTTVEIEQSTFSNRDTLPRELFDWCCLPEKDFLTAEAKTEIKLAISELSEPLRTVFSLRDLEGLSTSEVAHILDISEGSVKVRLHRARLALRARLSDYFSEWAKNQVTQ